MQSLKNKQLLGVTIPTESKQLVLEKIIKSLKQPSGFFHIVSLNPENLIIANQNEEFKKVVETAQIRINDGMGVVAASRWLEIEAGGRLTGVELMSDLIRQASIMRLRVLLIGGRPNLALRLAECYQQEFPEAKFLGTSGIKNIKNPEKEEEDKIFSIVGGFKPNIVFAAFGSPDQELWLARHNRQFAGTVVMGVGGAFDFLSGKISRAPVYLQKSGLEWLYRLVRQPWRWRRQTRLIKFTWLVLKQKYGRGNPAGD